MGHFLKITLKNSRTTLDKVYAEFQQKIESDNIGESEQYDKPL